MAGFVEAEIPVRGNPGHALRGLCVTDARQIAADPPALDLDLVFHGFGTSFKRLSKYELPWHSPTSGTGFACVVLAQAILDILRRTDVITIESRAEENIREKQVGVPGFEPGTSCSQSKRATRLRYTPNGQSEVSIMLTAIPRQAASERSMLI